MSSPFLSPLRYPGGKGHLAGFLGALISSQNRPCDTYVEPFAGGAGAALQMLFGEYVETIVINDLNHGVAAFWRATLDDTGGLVDRIMTCELSIEEWYRQREVYQSAAGSDLDIGFATFYLNRTNRSGILGARPIGGLAQQGQWLLDARFNRDSLANRVKRIAQYRNRITVLETDGLKLLAEDLRKRPTAFFYIDPPYLSQGGDLYLNTLAWADHLALAKLLRRSSAMWMLTYDFDERIPGVLYPGLRCEAFSTAHTAATQHVGTEYAVFGPGLSVGPGVRLRAPIGQGDSSRPQVGAV